MPDLSPFPITRRWPPADAERIQLYSFPTPNGIKVAVMLEEVGLAYEAHRISFADGDQKTGEFLSLNPNGKIPAMIDPDGPDGAPIALFESGAILLYLGEKTGRLVGGGAAGRAEIIQWLMWQMGGLGPMFGQLGFFVKHGGREIEDPRPRQRYVDEARRLLGVVERALDGRDWIAGEYSIADIAICPWLRALNGYGARDLVGWAENRRTVDYLDRWLARPAVQKGLDIPPREG